MKEEILKKLEEIELKYGIEILFAVESGSRAWGFASPDSDFDIRFVYKHPKNWYLNLWEQKDTVQFMTENDLDGAGWDLRKALKLLAKSNASFLGWLFSPIVYKENGAFLKEIKELAHRNFNPVSGFYHYHSMSKGFEETLGTEKMSLKSFFYAIRTVLCAKWIHERNIIPPVAFKELFPLVAPDLHSLLNELIALKSKRIEQSNEPIPDALLNLVRQIATENDRIKNELVNKKADHAAFNELFLKTIS